MKRSTLLAWTAAVAPLAFAATAQAQDEAIATAGVATVEALVINGEIAFRDRTNDVNPVLSYDLEYFQRFEPVSVGEMLKRVPGVTFTSDVLEFDGVSMRGLPPGYTQVLINGRRAPGGESDRSFFVDRIPAELVERIEIIRSPRADQPSDGMAGSLNIVLKESATLTGGFAKAGVLINSDGELRPSAAIAYAGGDEAFSWWGALNYQGRRNPKEKQSWRYDSDLDFDNTEYQSDTRDGVDISANGEATWRFDGGRLRVNGLVVDTKRDEDEVSLTYESLDRTAFDGAEVQAERIGQRTYSLSADGEFDLGPGELDVKLGWSAYREDTTTTVYEGDEEDLSDLSVDDVAELDIEDEELEAGAAYTFKFGDAFKLKGGVDFLRKTREASVDFTIEENRLDPFVRATFEPNEAFTLDLGLRYETTDREIVGEDGTVSYDAQELNPSAHLTFRPTANDQFRVSAVRTVRRPDYELLSPYFESEEPADEDGLRGNPALANETAWGLDAGYERRFGQRGIFGVNVFYRDISDLIEMVDTGIEVNEDGELPEEPEEGEEPEDLFNLNEPRNIGSGKTWGVEVDFSTPLTMVGLPDTGLFFNYTWMDSEVADPFTGVKRPFFDQPSNVYNIGFIHTLTALDMSFGASLYDRDMGYEFPLDEEGTVDYDADLEAFVEKRFGDRFVVRLAAMNLLDKEKRETYRKFDGDSIEDILENRATNEFDEYEIESERSGPLYQVTFRAAF